MFFYFLFPATNARKRIQWIEPAFVGIVFVWISLEHDEYNFKGQNDLQ